MVSTAMSCFLAECLEKNAIPCINSLEKYADNTPNVA